MTVLERFQLDGQLAVVTGGGGGIGRGIALGLAEAGADVVVAGRRPEPLERTAAEIEACGRRALAVRTDVTEPDQVHHLAERAGELGTVTCWVNNAGGLQEQRLGRLDEIGEAAFAAIVELNLISVWRGAKTAAGALADGGSIINVSSIGGMRPGMPGNGPYTAAKAAVNHLTTTLAAELAPRRIRVNAIAPGPVATEDYYDASGFTDAQFAKLAAKQPLGRLGEEEDFGSAAVFLASPASAWITGHVLVVAGMAV
jgi:7-alpha-hydroxysteroid dehydrogenase